MNQHAAPPPLTDTTALPQPDVGRNEHDTVISDAPPTRPRRRSGLIVAASLLAGLLAALVLVIGPFGGRREPVITGAFLLGFAVGWALLARLSVRFTDRPQRWPWFQRRRWRSPAPPSSSWFPERLP
jgi:hypothetical protein